jgi:hypothetical protein
MYTEPEMLETVNRLIEIYLESYPDDQDSLGQFVKWIYSQYGYEHGKS